MSDKQSISSLKSKKANDKHCKQDGCKNKKIAASNWSKHVATHKQDGVAEYGLC